VDNYLAPFLYNPGTYEPNPTVSPILKGTLEYSFIQKKHNHCVNQSRYHYEAEKITFLQVKTMYERDNKSKVLKMPLKPSNADQFSQFSIDAARDGKHDLNGTHLVAAWENNCLREFTKDQEDYLKRNNNFYIWATPEELHEALLREFPDPNLKYTNMQKYLVAMSVFLKQQRNGGQGLFDPNMNAHITEFLRGLPELKSLYAELDKADL
jgi:hypothetical protein